MAGGCGRRGPRLPTSASTERRPQILADVGLFARRQRAPPAHQPDPSIDIPIVRPEDPPPESSWEPLVDQVAFHLMHGMPDLVPHHVFEFLPVREFRGSNTD